LGLDNAYIRFYFETPEGVKRNQIFSLAVWTSVILNLIFCIIAVVIFPIQVGNYLFGENRKFLIMLLALYVMGLIIFRLLGIETRMEKNAMLYNTQQIILIITNRVSYVITACVTVDYKFSIVIITLSTCFFAILFLIRQKTITDFKIPHIGKEKCKYLYKFALPLMPTTLMTWLNNSLAKMILTSANDFSSVGILTVATSLANIFSIIPSAFGIYWAPFVYTNYKTEQLFIRKTHNYIMILSITIVMMIFCFEDILYVFVGGDYKSSQAYFMLVMLTPIQSLLCETTSYGIILNNKTQYNLIISILAVAVNVVVGLSLYKVMGIYGIVAGIASSAIFQFLLKSIIGQKYYRSIESWEKTILGGMLILVMAISNVFVYTRLFAKILIAICVLVAMITIYNKDLKSVMSFIYSKIRK
jgi:O-antigen/teichoic acid export membrane protein